MDKQEIIPSKYQQAIYDFVESGSGSGVVIAVAGSGKTTTIEGAAKKVPPEKEVVFVAFNKAIVDELRARGVKAQSLNGMGFAALRSHLDSNRFRLDTRKTSMIMDEHMNSQTLAIYGQGLRKLVGLAKAHGLLPKSCEGVGLTMDTEQNWADIIEKYGIEFERDGKPEEAIEFARKILVKSIQWAEDELLIDFDDQLYLPVIWQARFFQYDLLFVDEAQDVNLVQRAMLKMALKPGGRLIAVGDPKQAIYGFRGADTDSIDNIKKEFDAVELPLSVSYRCPRAVVAEAKNYVPYIEPSETAPEGSVTTLPEVYPELFENTDGIVCRNTAPLIDLAYKLLRGRKACRVLGREIGQGLVTVIKKMNADTVEELDERLVKYRDREVRKLMAKGKEEQADALTDRISTIQIFMDQLKETDRTISRLIQTINDLFTDNNKGLLTLCTVHKSKGLEFPRVFILNRELMPSKWARQDWQRQQEYNIIYVAITRAKESLCYISLENWKEKKPEVPNG